MNGFFLSKFIDQFFSQERKKWLAWLCAMHAVKENKNAYLFLCRTNYTLKQKKEWIMQITKPFVFNHAETLIDVVGKQSKNLSILTNIYPHFRARSYVDIHLTTMHPMPKSMQQKIKSQLKIPNATIFEHIDPSILGGFIIRIKDYLIDNSVIHMLKTLQEKLCNE